MVPYGTARREWVNKTSKILKLPKKMISVFKSMYTYIIYVCMQSTSLFETKCHMYDNHSNTTISKINNS